MFHHYKPCLVIVFLLIASILVPSYGLYGTSTNSGIQSTIFMKEPPPPINTDISLSTFPTLGSVTKLTFTVSVKELWEGEWEGSTKHIVSPSPNLSPQGRGTNL